MMNTHQNTEIFVFRLVRLTAKKKQEKTRKKINSSENFHLFDLLFFVFSISLTICLF